MTTPILNYHSVGTGISSELERWTISVENFRIHMRYLADNGFRGVTMAEALRNPAPNQVALSFDDGYEDFVTAAVPALNDYGFTATLFVATSYVGDKARWISDGPPQMATWRQLRDASADGFEIGAHSHTHPQLDLLDLADVREEIQQSRSLIEKNIDQPIEGFCYPHGFYRADVRQAVIDAGFSYACGVRQRMAHGHDDRFTLARIVVERDSSTDQIGRWLNGQDLRRSHLWVERSLALAYRSYRRFRTVR